MDDKNKALCDGLAKYIVDRNFDGDGPNVCFDLWLSAVERDGAHAVGYVEAAEAS